MRSILKRRDPKLEPQGSVAHGFEAVRQVFQESLQSGEEWGASVHIVVRGETVVDLWGGVRDRARGLAWKPDTLTTVFSCTKGIVALAFLMLSDRGKLDYDRPVAEYWPEFAEHGKESISVRTLLNHRAGLIFIDEPFGIVDLEHDWAKIARALAAQKPYWRPDTDQGYHGITYGLYAQELFRRISGETLGSFIRREIAEPLAADVHLGIDPATNERVAVNYPATTVERLTKILPKTLIHRGTDGRVYRQVVLRGDSARAFANPKDLGPLGIQNFNLPHVRALELPWANAVASARGLARVYSALAGGGEVDGIRLVSPEAIRPIMSRQSWAPRDRVIRKPLGWSQGFLKEETTLFSPNPESFGHPGAGGSLGWCDPKERVAIGYVTNKMDHRIRSKRALALCHALYRCL